MSDVHYLIDYQYRMISAFLPKGDEVLVVAYHLPYLGLEAKVTEELLSLSDARKLYRARRKHAEPVTGGCAVLETYNKYGKTFGYALASSEKDAEDLRGDLTEKFSSQAYSGFSVSGETHGGLYFAKWQRYSSCD